MTQEGILLPGWSCLLCGAFNGTAKETRETCRACAAPREMPYVCPGCYAVAPERCAPGCIDAEIEEERRDAIESGNYERDEDE